MGDMKVYCPYCGRRHDKGFNCGRRPQAQRSDRDSRAKRFRNTQAWKDKTRVIKQRDLHLCRLCLHNRILCAKQLEVHHIEPLFEAFDRRLDDDNLVTLCYWCHKRADRGGVDRNLLHKIARDPPGEVTAAD
ncbi:MAG: HNH endonuclease [Clostridia bacterium]|nr:HNH endonuclease [Clostridia bacterium]